MICQIIFYVYYSYSINIITGNSDLSHDLSYSYPFDTLELHKKNFYINGFNEKPLDLKEFFSFSVS